MRQGNVFTPVCHCSQGGVCVSQHALGQTQPPGQTYPSMHWGRHLPPGRHILACTGADTSPQADISYHAYKARHAHKRLYTVLPKYSKIQVLPGITSCRLMKYNKQAIELNSLLINNMPKDGYE